MIADELSERCAHESYMSLIRHRNTVHASLSFKRGVDPGTIDNTLSRFKEGLAKQVGTPSRCLNIVGVVLLGNEKEPHAHLIIHSPKSRKTGMTVSTMKDSNKAALEGAMAGSALFSFVLEPVYNLAGLIAYINGPDNLAAKGQKARLIQ